MSANALPATGVVRIGDRNLGSGVLDLNGHNQTLAGLYTDAASSQQQLLFDDVTNTSETNQLGNARQFKYDAAGDLVQKTDRNGRVTE